MTQLIHYNTDRFYTLRNKFWFNETFNFHLNDRKIIFAPILKLQFDRSQS